MSSRKRPLAELHNSHTPTRYAPSTPHALKALQQQSAAKTRSVRRKRALSDTVRPDSTRGILRQLARITAPTAKKLIPTPGTGRGKENRALDEGQEDGNEKLLKRPRLTLDIDESLESIEAPYLQEDDDEDDSELPIAPTPSILPDEDHERNETPRDDPTFTLKSIDYATNVRSFHPDQGASRHSFPASDPGIYPGDEESTFLSERGRRAPTAEPTEAISHYDFSEINVENTNRYEQSESPDKVQVDHTEIDISYVSLADGGGETEALQNLQDSHRSTPTAPEDEAYPDTSNFNDHEFQLPEPGLEVTARQIGEGTAFKVAEASPVASDPEEADIATGWESESEDVADLQAGEASLSNPLTQPPVISIEGSNAAVQTRRKKMKLTRHGEMVPSLPSSLIKRVAIQAQAHLGNRRPTLGKDHMRALEQATEWYFEQVGEDLAAYSTHARRKKRIDKSDVLLLLRRQRLLQRPGELAKTAREILPKEAVADMGLDELLEKDNSDSVNVVDSDT